MEKTTQDATWWNTALKLAAQVAEVALAIMIANAREDLPRRGDVYVRAHYRRY